MAVRFDRFDTSKEMKYSISTVIPFGQSEVHVGYSRSKYSSDTACPAAPAPFNPLTCGSVVQQYAATYQYNLSKRTAMYGTGSILDNKNPTTVGLAGGFGTPNPGGKSKGFEVGVRHVF